MRATWGTSSVKGLFFLLWHHLIALSHDVIYMLGAKGESRMSAEGRTSAPGRALELQHQGSNHIEGAAGWLEVHF